MADAITDLVQGIAVIIGLLVLAALAAAELGGLSQSLDRLEASRLVVLAPDATAQSTLEIVERWLVPICGTIVAIELVSRILGCRSAEVARSATMAGALLYLAVGLIPVYLGLVGPQLVAGLSGEDVEQIVPRLAERLLPGLLFVLFAGALISAILSTVDSVLLAAASMISHNVVMRMLTSPSERLKLRSVRLTVVALAVLAYALALHAGSVGDLVEVAAAAGSSGVIVCLVLGLFTRWGGAVSATAAMLAGALVWLLAELLELTSTPYLLAVAIALLAYLAGLAVPDGARQEPADAA